MTDGDGEKKTETPTLKPPAGEGEDMYSASTVVGKPPPEILALIAEAKETRAAKANDEKKSLATPPVPSFGPVLTSSSAEEMDDGWGSTEEKPAAPSSPLGESMPTPPPFAVYQPSEPTRKVDPKALVAELKAAQAPPRPPPKRIPTPMGTPIATSKLAQLGMAAPGGPAKHPSANAMPAAQVPPTPARAAAAPIEEEKEDLSQPPSSKTRTDPLPAEHRAPSSNRKAAAPVGEIAHENGAAIPKTPAPISPAPIAESPVAAPVAPMVAPMTPPSGLAPIPSLAPPPKSASKLFPLLVLLVLALIAGTAWWAFKK